MSFSPLSEYSEGSFPSCGSATSYTICEGVSGYKPIDVSGLKGTIDSAFDTAMADSDSNQEQIKGRVNDLSNEWGTKFISIDNKDLNIVNLDTFVEDINIINKNLDEQKNRCNEIVSTIVTKTDHVNDYLKVIEENNKKYEKVKQELEKYERREADLINRYNSIANRENPSLGSLSLINSQLSSVRSLIKFYSLEVKKYEAARIDSPDGSWVLG